MKRRASERIAPWALGATLCAALALGALAFFLSRHEEEVRKNQFRDLLKTEAKLFAERCRKHMEHLRIGWIARAAQTEPTPEGLDATLRVEPFFRHGFLAESKGDLLYPARSERWARRYYELFSELVSAETDATEEHESALPRNGAAQRMESRFALLASRSDGGMIPWFSDNQYAPLVWAANRKNAAKIVGFELDAIMLWAQLIPLFPDRLPEFFRMELIDAGGRLLHATGGESHGTPEITHLSALDSALLPNLQLRAMLLQENLPAGTGALGVWMGITALLLLFLGAGGLSLSLIRRELRIARQKSSFVSQVSHELKTPLTNIRMYAELLRDHNGELTEEKRMRYLQVMVEESERLSRLVGNVLDFSRLDDGRKHYAPEEIDLASFLRETLDFLQEKCPSLIFSLRLPAEPVNTVLDRDSLLQVLHNLVDNASKYAASGKKLDVELRQGEIRVRDYGPGIAPGAETRIFQQFFRADTSLNATATGFGLGLSIARALLRDQKGDLRYEPSHPGACFIIVFPGEAPHET